MKDFFRNRANFYTNMSICNKNTNYLLKPWRKCRGVAFSSFRRFIINISLEYLITYGSIWRKTISPSTLMFGLNLAFCTMYLFHASSSFLVLIPFSQAILCNCAHNKILHANQFLCSPTAPGAQQLVVYP